MKKLIVHVISKPMQNVRELARDRKEENIAASSRYARKYWSFMESEETILFLYSGYKSREPSGGHRKVRTCVLFIPDKWKGALYVRIGAYFHPYEALVFPLLLHNCSLTLSIFRKCHKFKEN